MKLAHQLKFIVLFWLILVSIGCISNKKMINNSTVEKLEIDKFTGTWYEIARYDHRFEQELVGVTATYSKLENGKLQVLNKGHKNSLDNAEKNIIGKAKIPDLNKPGNLKVSFFWFFYADYLVMELDDLNYQWAVIGSSSPNYLWILNRTPFMDDKLYSDILEKIKNRGYDTDKLILVPQK